MNQTPRNAIIFVNGDKADLSTIDTYITADSLLIGCDGGTEHIYLKGLKPAVILGDFDSFNVPAAAVKDPAVSYLQFPVDKDFTDSELAIDYAVQLGIKDIVVVGCLGSRIDHLLGNIFLLAQQKYADCQLTIIEGDQRLFVIRKRATIRGHSGDTISFMAIGGAVEVTGSKGLKYDLSKYKLSMIDGNPGISNVMSDDTAEVTIKRGLLLVVHKEIVKN